MSLMGPLYTKILDSKGEKKIVAEPKKNLVSFFPKRYTLTTFFILNTLEAPKNWEH